MIVDTSAPTLDTLAAHDAHVQRLQEQLAKLRAPRHRVALAAERGDDRAVDELVDRDMQIAELQGQIDRAHEARPELVREIRDAQRRRHDAAVVKAGLQCVPLVETVQRERHIFETTAGIPSKHTLIAFEKNARRAVALTSNLHRLTGDRTFAIVDPWAALARQWRSEAREREKLLAFVEDVRRANPRLGEDVLLDSVLKLVAEQSELENTK